MTRLEGEYLAVPTDDAPAVDVVLDIHERSNGSHSVVSISPWSDVDAIPVNGARVQIKATNLAMGAHLLGFVASMMRKTQPVDSAHKHDGGTP